MFVVIEGIDGCGKSTQAARLTEWLTSRLGREMVVSASEPGGWDGGGVVRELVLGGNLTSMWSEFFLFMMDRCEHVSRVIAPALKKGQFVLCDRYSPSTLAYQVLACPDVSDETAGYMIGLSDRIGLPIPDCVCLLDIDPDTARRRLDRRGKADSFDTRGKDFFSRVRDGYDRLMKSSNGNWIKIDATPDEETVFGVLTRRLGGLLQSEEPM
jgi:dTMP kinase